MKESNADTLGDFYFALPRVVNRLRGHSDKVSESNAAEAYLGSIGVFVVTFFFALQLFAGQLTGWQAIPISILLVFAVWIFWLLVFYTNSLVITTLRACGFFRETPNRHAQDILIGIVIAALAYELSIFDSWTRWIGILCLLILAANLLAALFLALSRERS